MIGLVVRDLCIPLIIDRTMRRVHLRLITTTMMMAMVVMRMKRSILVSYVICCHFLGIYISFIFEYFSGDVWVYMLHFW